MPPIKHSKLGPSSAAMWLRCPPSANINAAHGDTSSVYADEGSLAHELAEFKVKKHYGIPKPIGGHKAYKEAHDLIKAKPLYDPEMERCTDEYLEHIQSLTLAVDIKPLVVVEQQVDYSLFVPGGFGTSDCIIVTPDTLHVIDYKHGKGVPVTAKENEQMRLYGLGGLILYQAFYPFIEKVVMHIVQPRAGGITTDEISRNDLLDWATFYVKPRALLADKGEGEFCPGEKQCRWCCIAGSCRARAEQAQSIAANADFGKLPPEISNADVAKFMKLGQDVAGWLKKLEEYATSVLLAGGEIPGYKLVAGRANREWRDQAAAFEALKAAGVDEALLWERKPLSAPATEKVVDKKVFAQAAVPHIHVPPGKPTLAPESDSRKPWNPAQADFASVGAGAGVPD